MNCQDESIREPIRVLLVDDSEHVLWGMGKVIDAERPHMRVVGKARCCAEALASLRTQRPDVVLLDINLADENGLDCLPRLLDGTRVQVLVLTSARDPELHARALQLGASAVIRKEMPARVVLDAIARTRAEPPTTRAL
jgi:DNA-binding NarL/FixJ family response regulator